MKTQHTPGPWVAICGNIPELMNGKRRAFFPHVKIPSSLGTNREELTINAGGWDIETHDANARLIAAAPDLLAALIDLDEVFCSINEFSTKEERHDARLKLIAARAAIAKAKGEVPA